VFRSARAAAQPHFQSSKIAFLIAAHTEPKLLARLVSVLASPWSHVFVHVDAKADIGIFLHELSDTSGVTLIRDRVRVYWGGWSQVEASLRLMQTALEHDPAFARFVLLSGCCYPLRSNRSLRDHLFTDDAEYIGLVRMPDAKAEKPIERLTRWHFEGGDRTIGGKAALLRLLNRATFYGPPRDAMTALDGFVPYAGSSWWALTRDTVQTIMHTVATRPELVALFRHSAFPDESFFHTIVANSVPPERIRGPLTFADWTPGPERPHPVCTLHLARLLGPDRCEEWPPYFFARKFSARNAHLLDVIDAARRETDAPAEAAHAAA